MKKVIFLQQLESRVSVPWLVQRDCWCSIHRFQVKLQQLGNMDLHDIVEHHGIPFRPTARTMQGKFARHTFFDFYLDVPFSTPWSTLSARIYEKRTNSILWNSNNRSYTKWKIKKISCQSRLLSPFQLRHVSYLQHAVLLTWTLLN